MPEVAFVVSAGQHHPQRELAETLRYELELQGVPGALHIGSFPPPRTGLVYVLLDPIGYLAAEGERSLPAAEVLRRTIFVCPTAPGPLPGPTPTRDQVELLNRAGAVFVLDQRSVVLMHRAGVPARLLRPGYSRSLDRFDPEAERTVDVMFMGAHSARRARYLARAARVLSWRNCLLQVSEDAPSAGPTSSYLAGNRWPLLARTNVVLQIHHGEDAGFDWRAALDAIHAGAVVVSEHATGIAPLVPGEHLLVAEAEALPSVADALLRNPERLAALRTAAHERLSNWVPFALPVSVLRAAIVELVGEPVSPAAPLTGFGLGPPGSDTVPPAPWRDREIEGLREQLHRTQREAAAARRDLAEVRDRVGGMTAGSRPASIVHRNGAWAAVRAPRLSIITALHGVAGSLEATLDSVARSWLRELELVVVDAGAEPGVRSRALEWLARHPRIPAQLLTAGDRRGRGAARNIALDFARGPYCLLLDPGQELYPLALHVLAGTLDAMPDAAFAYPIQEVVGEPDAFVDAGGDYLMSYLGWDPGRLRRGNHIHGPVLLRADRLREIGGFCTDPRLEGVEDYDLWCRIAERGWIGQLVPQELGRRVESGASEVLWALRPSPGPAADALMERSPGVMAGAF